MFWNKKHIYIYNRGYFSYFKDNERNMTGMGIVARDHEGSLINDTKQFLEQFQSWKIVHVSRSCNVVAHKLARLSLTCRDEMFWHGAAPSCISGDISAEAGLHI
jgi:hypothetical protein